MLYHWITTESEENHYDIYLDDYSIYNRKDLVEKLKFGQFK